ncbi:IPT/TIG domain-containing protein [Actinoplanes sp. NPDC048791]|uniref:IPT/TIG domain-containing protein n=1 Tax=Actinoplanes sp. NPDC048791 TaxID=3154623 RepID=UPI0033DB2461
MSTIHAASAAPAAVATPDTGPVGGGNTVAVVLSNFVSSNTVVGARLQTGTGACAAYGTASASNLAATATKFDASTVNVVIPSGVVLGTTYRICIYGLASGTLLSTSTAIAQDDYTVVADVPVLSPTTGPAGGGNIITATGTAPYLTGTTTPAVLFSTATCPATYATPDATKILATTTRTDSVASITVPAGAVAPNTYYVCVYKGNTVGSSALIGGSSTTYTPGAPEVTLSGTTGPNAGGNTLTTTAAAFGDLSATALGVNFSTTACDTTYEDTSAAAAALAGPATRAGTTVTFTVPSGVLAPAEYNVCLYNGTTDETSALLAVGKGKYSVTLPDVTTSPNVGATATAKTITLTSASPILSGVSGPGVTFSVAACPSTYTATGSNFAGTTPKRITDTIGSVVVPTSVVLGSGATTAYNVCLYNGTAADSILLANAGTYTVAAQFTVDPNPIDLDGGPAQGGTLITVTGTGFPTGADAITASLGGAPLKNIKRTGSTTFTGVTTAHAPGMVNLSVTTAAGTIIRSNAFEYSYGITVQPNTAPSNTTRDIYVTGAGFLDLDFAEAGEPSANSEAHVYLVDGVYDATDTTPTEKDNPPVAECEAALVLSDTALLCSLNLEDKLIPATGLQIGGGGTPVPDGVYTVAVVNTGLAAAAAASASVTISASILTSGSTFTVSDY